ncbi:hypothetical protein LJC40_01685 [Synergistaceae bacterium OttesenSCG-928-D05]|nr:hypothetical protein [Synergistaceae bacterium OttesenSCG-928-D05]
MSDTSKQGQSSSVNPVIWIYAILSPCAVVYFVLWGNGHGFFRNLLPFVCFSIVAFIGALVGDFIRRLLMPAFIVGRDTSDMILSQIFWWIGPQAIGMALGVGFIRKWFF